MSIISSLLLSLAFSGSPAQPVAHFQRAQVTDTAPRHPIAKGGSGGSSPPPEPVKPLQRDLYSYQLMIETPRENYISSYRANCDTPLTAKQIKLLQEAYLKELSTNSQPG